MPRPNVSGERKPQILKAAMKVFNRRGIAATRMEDIAREADLSVGGVYWYYKGKDDVILAIMDELINADVAALTSLLAAPGTLRERLTEYMRATANESIAYLPLTYELYGLALHNSKIRKYIQKYFSHYREALTQILLQGIKRGEIRKVNVYAVATTLSAAYEGMLELALIDPQNVNAEDALAQTIEFLFDGIKNSQAIHS